MFNIFKGNNAKKVANNPLASLSEDIQKAKAKKENVKEEHEKNEQVFYESFNNGIKLLHELLKPNGYSKEKFDLCLDNLLKASQMKPTEPASYYYLSFILSILGKKEEAMDYFDIVNYIDPNYDGLSELYSQINQLEDETEFDPLPEVESEEIHSFINELVFSKK